jgi:hypothetical protein
MFVDNSGNIVVSQTQFHSFSIAKYGVVKEEVIFNMIIPDKGDDVGYFSTGLNHDGSPLPPLAGGKRPGAIIGWVNGEQLRDLLITNGYFE